MLIGCKTEAKTPKEDECFVCVKDIGHNVWLYYDKETGVEYLVLHSYKGEEKAIYARINIDGTPKVHKEE